MEHCIFCGIEIKKESEEHILLNSLGGKLVYKNLICEKCNNLFGSGIDSKLSEILYPYASLLNVDRDRGNNKNILTKKDIDYYMKPGGVPALKKFKINEKNIGKGEFNIFIEANDEEQAKLAIKYIENKYKNKIDKKSVVLEKKQVFVNEKIPIETNISTEMFPSIIKTAIEFCKVKLDVDISDIINRFNNKDYKNCYYCIIDIVDIDIESIFHILYLFQYNQCLYCYVNYFGIIGFVVKLSDNINISVEESYVYDLINRNIVDYSHYKLNEDLLKNFRFNNSFTSDDCEILRMKITDFINIYYKNSKRIIVNNLIDDTMDEVFHNNEYYSQQTHNEFISKFLKKLAPYLAHWMGK